MSSSNCCFFTCIQISQEEGQVVCYSHFFKNFPQFVVIYTVKGFCVVNEAKVDGFLIFPCFLFDPKNVVNLFSGSSAFSKSSLNIVISQFTYCWSLAWRILSIILLECAIVWWFEHFWHCPSLQLEWKLTFFSPVATAEFSKVVGIMNAVL